MLRQQGEKMAQKKERQKERNEWTIVWFSKESKKLDDLINGGGKKDGRKKERKKRKKDIKEGTMVIKKERNKESMIIGMI